MPLDRDRVVLGVATLVATIATLGSLWFSLGLGLVPCDLCWYQRILMYPQVVILGVATLESRLNVWRTVLPLSAAGIIIAAYQSYLQATTTTCGFEGACAVVQWRSPILRVTIPNLSLIAFVLVTALLLSSLLVDRNAGMQVDE
ncbi:disulfide bond formation protein B (plasmid) [Halobacterium sp. NMX12-1]|uniref:Disulfide bond formation protein B n=1 Tax=Halobacterium sp. NMX12-1 TaxID=3166650 RepID=A0AAU8CH13_9EURY|nr:disulfide bond formation protein B [Halobacterium sp. KA-4]MCD2200690.1 disulfide bond formation protein B [Halobacterium sp. KA-4]